MASSRRSQAIVQRFVARACAAVSTAAYAARLSFRHAPLPAALLLMQSVAAGAAVPLAVWAIAGLIDALARAQNAPAGAWSAVWPWLALLLLASALRSAESAAATYLSSLCSRSATSFSVARPHTSGASTSSRTC